MISEDGTGAGSIPVSRAVITKSSWDPVGAHHDAPTQKWYMVYRNWCGMPAGGGTF